MFTLRQPTPSSFDALLARARDQTFSYPEVGGTLGKVPAGYVVDHNRVRLGSGNATYLAAISAIRAWEMFNFEWIRLEPRNAPIKVGTTVAIAAHHLGCWSQSAARIISVIQEEWRFGFAYGTLQEHVERGEERFSVEWSGQDDSVFYDILAFSKPNAWQARLGYPIARILQRRFARDSLAAMKRAVGVR
jgi:uncharacterized protein (UPF0548 family)